MWKQSKFVILQPVLQTRKNERREKKAAAEDICDAVHAEGILYESLRDNMDARRLMD